MPKLSNTVTRKFVDTLEVSDWEIETDGGWVDITHINKTIEYQVYRLTTTTGTIECADTHILFRENGEEVFVKDLLPGDTLKGQFASESVLDIEKTDKLENMFDLSVTGDHTFYAEGLLHHNTTCAAAYILWCMIFLREKTLAILANKAVQAREIMHRIRQAYEYLPAFLQHGVITWNKGGIELENGCRAFANATSPSAIRGQSIYLAYLDEFGFVENNIAEDFMTSVYPTLSSGKETKIIITSTPNGYNHFWKIWDDAEKKLNGFIPLRVNWWQTPGRDERWRLDMLATLGELKFKQEVEAAFQGSAMTLLSGSSLAKLNPEIPIKVFDDTYHGLKIYKEPVEKHSYVITVDVSRGRHLDYSAFIVFDVTQAPFTIAATYYNNEIPPMFYSAIIHKMAKNYKDAYTLIEINDVGAQVAETIYHEYEYENLFWTKGGAELGKSGADPYPGIRTTKKTKRIGCSNLKDLVDKDQLKINDISLISELSTFIQNTSGSYEADTGNHDDLTMCCVLFAWLVIQPWFKDLTNSDIQNTIYEKMVKQMEEDLAPFMFHSTGHDEEDENNSGFELLR